MDRIKVKLVHRASDGHSTPFYKQFPGGKPIWGNCIFHFDVESTDYDWLVVVDDIPKVKKNKTEELSCPRGKTILATTEPSSVTRYGKSFINQFGYVLTNQESKYVSHPNIIRSQTGNVWFYEKSYDDLLKDSPRKNKLISTVCSSKKQGHTMHRKRFDFVARLQTELPEMERYGHGIKFINNKSEAIDDYKFHLAIENHIGPDIWTEKLSDPFLGFSIPIYCGATNAKDYFPVDSFVEIDIREPDAAIKKIKEIINIEGEYERRLDAVKEARRRVMDEYNFLAVISNIVENKNPADCSDGNGKIKDRRTMRFTNPKDLMSHSLWQLIIALRNIRFK